MLFKPRDSLRHLMGTSLILFHVSSPAEGRNPSHQTASRAHLDHVPLRLRRRTSPQRMALPSRGLGAVHFTGVFGDCSLPGRRFNGCISDLKIPVDACPPALDRSSHLDHPARRTSPARGFPPWPTLASIPPGADAYRAEALTLVRKNSSLPVGAWSCRCGTSRASHQ